MTLNHLRAMRLLPLAAAVAVAAAIVLTVTRADADKTETGLALFDDAQTSMLEVVQSKVPAELHDTFLTRQLWSEKHVVGASPGRAVVLVETPQTLTFAAESASKVCLFHIEEGQGVTTTCEEASEVKSHGMYLSIVRPGGDESMNSVLLLPDDAVDITVTDERIIATGHRYAVVNFPKSAFSEIVHTSWTHPDGSTTPIGMGQPGNPQKHTNGENS